MPSRICALVFAFLACGGEPNTTSTMTDGSTGGSTGGGTTGGSTTAQPTSSPASTGTIDTGGTGTGTESASGTDTGEPTTGGVATEPGTDTGTTEGGGTGGQGSGMACAKWYGAIAGSYEPICECEVQKGTYQTIEACLAAVAPPPDCACSIFAQSPETAAILACYEKAAQAKTDCLGDLNLCIGDIPLDLCVLQELDALLKCGMPSAEVCQQLKTMCGEAVPPICG